MDLRSIKYIDSNGDVLYAEPGQEIVCSPAASRSTAKLMKTGQSISYKSWDDGDIRAGRDNGFTVLLENNPFGNGDRFTDELGGQTYTNNIVIDWSTYDGSTVLGWYRLPQGPSNWDTAIDNSLSFSIGSFASGWRVGNIGEYFSICNFGENVSLNYSPLNISNAAYFHTSTTYKINSVNAMKLFYTGQFFADPKANNALSLFCRTFTVTGTILS